MYYHGGGMSSHRKIDWTAAVGSAPATLEGRAVVRKLPSYNSIADITLLRTENRAEFEEMRKALEAEYRPAGFFDMEYFETMLSAKWRLRRVQKAEASMPILVTKLASYKRHLKRMFNGAKKEMLRPRTRVQ
jgi:hypothetical protein